MIMVLCQNCGRESYTAATEPADRQAHDCPHCQPPGCKDCAALIATLRQEIATLSDDLSVANQMITKLQAGDSHV